MQSKLLQRFWPASLHVSPQEKLRMVLGAGLGVLFAGILSQYAGQGLGPWLVAPIGASAVLVFGLPSSPLAQPWSVVGGNTLSALVGTAIAFIFHDNLAVAAALAVALSMVVMLWGRCLHPPGGASALLVVLMQKPSLNTVLFAFLLNSVFLVIAGLVYNNLTGRSYPHHAKLDRDDVDAVDRFTQSDLNTALAHYQELLDVDPSDLAQLLQYAESAAYQRTLGDLRCEEVMSRSPHSVEFGSSLSEAWGLMRRHHVKALPVVDRARRVVGIITLADFLKHVQIDEYMELSERLKSVWQSTGVSHSDKPEVVEQIMTRRVRVASAHSYLAELLPLFSQTGHHHLPVIDSENRLIGILTQSDVVSALVKAVRPHTSTHQG
jgi:CBS domain-containing membrane protein